MKVTCEMNPQVVLRINARPMVPTIDFEPDMKWVTTALQTLVCLSRVDDDAKCYMLSELPRLVRLLNSFDSFIFSSLN